MKDRLSQIMGTGAALDLLSPEVRSRLLSASSSPAMARLAAWDMLTEAQRMAVVRASGAVPVDCGDAIPEAPARGAMRAFHAYDSYPDGAEGSVLKPSGFLGRKTAQVADAFDRMRHQAQRRSGRFALTVSQVQMGREYSTLVRDRDSGAVRGISIETMLGGGSRGGTREGFTDHRLDISRRIDRLQGRIGQGCGLAIRRVRPSKRGDGKDMRRNIPDRQLVDLVCLDEELTVSEVLRRFGWSVKGDTVSAATAALAAALDRMIGPARAPSITAVSFGTGCTTLLGGGDTTP